jgi:Holliday junction resolvasome RuvABC endonuclease subunit
MKKERRSGHATGMAGEFLVMEKLFRLGHEPALTLGTAKSVDILVRKKNGTKVEVSVKAIAGGGKWGVSSENESQCKDRVYVLLYYKDFDDPNAAVDAFVIPACEAQSLKEPWLGSRVAVYCSNSISRARLEKYRDAWQLV